MSRAPHLYGLPQIHKTDNPLRPIVSAVGFPTYNLDRFVTSIISPLMGQTSSYVNNSKHLSNMVSSESEVMVSFDMQSLFTNVPVAHGLDKRLEEDKTLGDRTTLTADKVILLLVNLLGIPPAVLSAEPSLRQKEIQCCYIAICPERGLPWNPKNPPGSATAYCSH